MKINQLNIEIMKKAAVLVLAIILAASCCSLSRMETVDMNEHVFDTLRVNVLILDGDTLDGTFNIKLNDQGWGIVLTDIED